MMKYKMANMGFWAEEALGVLLPLNLFGYTAFRDSTYLSYTRTNSDAEIIEELDGSALAVSIEKAWELKMDRFAEDIVWFLKEHSLWSNCSLYYNGNRLSADANDASASLAGSV